MLAGNTVVVGITGGVAAHYLPELIGQLRFRHLATVYAVMTPAAARFVSPLTVAAAAGTPVWQDIFEGAEQSPLAHIHLARLADLALVTPAPSCNATWKRSRAWVIKLCRRKPACKRPTTWVKGAWPVSAPSWPR